MPRTVQPDEGSRLAKTPAARSRRSKSEAAKRALAEELHRLEQSAPLKQRLRPLQQRVLARKATGLDADKEFYDSLGGDP